MKASFLLFACAKTKRGRESQPRSDSMLPSTLGSQAAGHGQGWEFGRSERIRTFDPRLPKAVLYQTELHSENRWQGPAKAARL
jgi:hypothetical protein